MTVALTGGSGFLGCALVRRLLDSGSASLRLLVRADSDISALERVLAGYDSSRWRIVRCGFDDPGALRDALDAVDLVFHLAAAMRGGPAAIARGTLGPTQRLITALRELPQAPRVVLISSLGVYASAALSDGDRVDENSLLEPLPHLRDAYTHAKLEQERWFAHAHATAGIPLAIVRPGVIYGPGHAAPGDRVGLRLPFGLLLAPGLRCRLPLTFVDNCAEAVRVVGERARFAGEAYNVVDAECLRGRDWLRQPRDAATRLRAIPCSPAMARQLARGWALLRRATGGRLPVLLSPYQADTAWRDLNYASALDRLGYVQPIPLLQALARTFPSAA